jgi:hypothetical protein
MSIFDFGNDVVDWTQPSRSAVDDLPQPQQDNGYDDMVLHLDPTRPQKTEPDYLIWRNDMPSLPPEHQIWRYNDPHPKPENEFLSAQTGETAQPAPAPEETSAPAPADPTSSHPILDNTLAAASSDDIAPPKSPGIFDYGQGTPDFTQPSRPAQGTNETSVAAPPSPASDTADQTPSWKPAPTPTFGSDAGNSGATTSDNDDKDKSQTPLQPPEGGAHHI